MTNKSLYIGVDLGRSTRIALVNGEGIILSQERVPTELTSGRALVDGLIALLRRVKASAAAPVEAIGIGLPGLIDHRTQQVKVLPNLPDVSAIDVHRELVQANGLPVVLDND